MELFKEFAAHSARQWREQIMKDLKGADIKNLEWHSDNGFTIHPFYTAEDLKDHPEPIFVRNGWDICANIFVSDPLKANQQALMALKQGASGLVFRVHKKIDTKVLLNGIQAENIYLQFDISNNALHLLKDLEDIHGKKNEHDGKIKCFVNIDPLLMLAQYGEWHEDEHKDLDVIADLPHIPVNLSVYLEAGANTVNELAIGLSHLNEYFNFLSDKRQINQKIIHLTLSVKGDFFGEIAKLRALRKLVELLQEQYGTGLQVQIHAQTASINKSSLDAYNNMIRSTTECMSAILGGCDSISVLPYNNGFEDADEFSLRMAINQQHICRDEAYIGKVNDISAGSYYIESLSDELARHAWERFKEIEKQGGYIAAFKSGFIQDLIDKDATELRKEVEASGKILVGVNKYQNPKEDLKASNFTGKTSKESESPFRRIKMIRPALSFEKEKLMNKTKV